MDQGLLLLLSCSHITLHSQQAVHLWSSYLPRPLGGFTHLPKPPLIFCYLLPPLKHPQTPHPPPFVDFMQPLVPGFLRILEHSRHHSEHPPRCWVPVTGGGVHCVGVVWSCRLFLSLRDSLMTLLTKKWPRLTRFRGFELIPDTAKEFTHALQIEYSNAEQSQGTRSYLCS